MPAWEVGEDGTNKQTNPLPCACTMPTFEIPAGPANTQKSTAYHVPREEACCAKHCIMMPPKESMTYVTSTMDAA